MKEIENIVKNKISDMLMQKEPLMEELKSQREKLKYLTEINEDFLYNHF